MCSACGPAADPNQDPQTGPHIWGRARAPKREAGPQPGPRSRFGDRNAGRDLAGRGCPPTVGGHPLPAKMRAANWRLKEDRAPREKRSRSKFPTQKPDSHCQPITLSRSCSGSQQLDALKYWLDKTGWHTRKHRNPQDVAGRVGRSHGSGGGALVLISPCDARIDCSRGGALVLISWAGRSHCYRGGALVLTAPSAARIDMAAGRSYWYRGRALVLISRAGSPRPTSRDPESGPRSLGNTGPQQSRG